MKASKLLSCLVLALAVAQVALVLVSWLLSATTVDGVRSLLSSEGVRWYVGHFTDSLLSPLLVWLLLLSMAFGSLSRCGLLTRSHTEYRERVALCTSLLLLVAYVGVVLSLTVIPHAVLLGATGQLFPSPFSRSLVPLVAFGVVAVSVCYGTLSGRFKSLADICQSLSFGISFASPLFLLYVLLIQFCESLRFVFA